MAHYDLEEQEQIDSIKTWWKMYGNLVTALVSALALAVVGWQGWNWYQNNETGKAAMVFAALEQAVQAADQQRVKSTAGELTEKFPGSGYAALGALLAAKQSFEAGDLKTSKAQLGWVADNAKDELRDIARLRLASLLLDEQAHDEALKQLAATHRPAFAASFLELKGDVMSAQGNAAEARAAYKAALEKLSSKDGGTVRELLQQKIDSLGETA